MQLKEYQQDCLNKLREYAVECRKHLPEDGAGFAFSKLGVSERRYHSLSDDNFAPIVCIKVPTGGGTTFIAAHSVGVIFESFLKERGDAGLVMWFVPSDAILKQTLRALQNRTNDIRASMDARFDAKVRVLDIAEAKTIKKNDIAENVCIVVSTLSAFRREQKEALKVFQNNGALMGHFEDVPEAKQKNLEKKDGIVISSLANVFRLHNPFVIVDEGHNIEAELSFDTIKTLNPSFVLEFTATPRAASNILITVSARELKRQKMIKMPIRLSNITPWQNTILEGIKKRKELEKLADKNKTGYIRPIMLIQAEQEKESDKRIFVSQIEKFLVEEAKIDETEIAIKTGKRPDELPDAETLSSPDCKINYIITVNALKEGWDCPFAYILVSVSNLGAALSVEQTIGRVMRLPYVREHAAEELNKAYIFGTTNSFTKTADAVIAALKQNGYEDVEIEGGEADFSGGIAKKTVKEKIELPYINVRVENGVWRPLDYVEDIIGSEPLLAGVSADIGFSGGDVSEMIEIDFSRKGELVKEKVGPYTVSAEWKGEDSERLIAWLCRKTQRGFISQKEMSAFVRRVLAHLFSQKGITLKKLNKERYKLKERLDTALDVIIEESARKRFAKLERDGLLKSAGKGFVFPAEFSLTRISREPFSKCAYDKVDYLNTEEVEFAKRIDNLPNVEWWARNPREGGFCLSGWQRTRFFPDFVVRTKNKAIFVFEYKGKQLATGEDTEYKKTLGKKWADLSGERCHFAIAEKKTMDALITRLSKE